MRRPFHAAEDSHPVLRAERSWLRSGRTAARHRSRAYRCPPRFATLNGARTRGRDDRIGIIAPGKQADLVVINGNPAATIGDIRKVETVFKHGVGYDPAKLIESRRGVVFEK